LSCRSWRSKYIRQMRVRSSCLTLWASVASPTVAITAAWTTDRTPQPRLRLFRSRNTGVRHPQSPGSEGNRLLQPAQRHHRQRGLAKQFRVRRNGRPDHCTAQIRLDAVAGTLQTTCQDNGFLSLKFTNGVWPFPTSSTPPACRTDLVCRRARDHSKSRRPRRDFVLMSRFPPSATPLDSARAVAERA
jgi:hypothetical protein